MSYFRLLYHIVFRTKYRHPTILISYEKELYNYIWGFTKNKDSKLYRIGGMPDHLHLLLDLSAKLALADFMRDLKTSSAKWLKTNTHFPAFQGWGNGYAAFTYNIKEKDTIVNYIMNQKEHHARVKFEDEIHDLFQANGCGDMEKYFLEDN
jgi:REP element-mobilizing transposase RayT